MHASDSQAGRQAVTHSLTLPRRNDGTALDQRTQTKSRTFAHDDVSDMPF